MGLKDLIGGIFKSKTADPQVQTISVNGATYVPAEANIQLQKAALHICKDYIASAISKCEIRTFLRGKEVFGAEYYLWNYSPNLNQTSTEFWRDVIYKLYESGEVLIVPIGKQMMVADTFEKERYDLKPTIFSRITRGSLTLNRTFDSTSAIYLTLPDSVRPDNLLSGINDVINGTLQEAIEKYHFEGGERGTFEYEAMKTGDEEYAAAIQKLLDEDFAAYFKARNAVVPIYAGTKYTPQVNRIGQNTSIVGDITALLDQSIKTTAQAMKIPPSLILGEVADTKTAVSNFLSFCIDPLTDMIAEAINSVRYGEEVLKGSYVSVDTSYIEHVDVFSLAANIDKIRAASILNTNEIRRKISEPRINELWADEYAITKNYESVSTAGGKGNGNTHNEN